MDFYYIKRENVQYSIDNYYTLSIYVYGRSLCTISDVHKEGEELDIFIDEILREHNYIVEE